MLGKHLRHVIIDWSRYFSVSFARWQDRSIYTAAAAASLLAECWLLEHWIATAVIVQNKISHYRVTSFYPRDAMLPRVFGRATCLSVRRSVRLSHAGIISNRRKLASWFLHHLVAPRFYFSGAKFHHKIRKGSPRARASNQGGVGKTRIVLALSGNISKTVRDTSKVTINH